MSYWARRSTQERLDRLAQMSPDHIGQDHFPIWTQGDATDVRAQMLAQLKVDDGLQITDGMPIVSKGKGFVIGKVPAAGVADGSVTLNKLAPNSVDSSKIVDGTIVNADVAPGAAIAYTKLNLVNSITANDLATDSVGAAELAANSVASANIIDGSIVNADVAAASLQPSRFANAFGRVDGSTSVCGNTASSVISWVNVRANTAYVGANTGGLVCLVTGTYLICGGLLCPSAGAAGMRQIQLLLNGSAVGAISTIRGDVGGFAYGLNVSTIRNMTANNTIDLEFYQNSGAAITLTNDQRTFLAAYLLAS